MFRSPMGGQKPSALPMRSDHEIAERIERLHLAADRKAPAFQSVLAVVVAGIVAARLAERNVVEAAISLAHREKLGAMLVETDLVIDALVALSEYPLPVQEADEIDEESGDAWWFALAEATHVLETGIDRMSALVGAQEKGSGVRDLVSSVVRHMRNHHALLLGEAERRIEG